VKYGFILKESKYYPVNVLCREMQVKRSSYYDWKANSISRVVDVTELNIRREMKRLFDESRQSIGSRRMCKMLQNIGFNIGRFKARRLMKSLNLVVKYKRRFKATTNSRHNLPVAGNLLDREFYPEGANKVWGSDITYIWTASGWLYLAVIIDLYSKKVVGWCVDSRMTKSLVMRALLMAVNLRKPKPGLILHSDRGSQYASHDYQKLLRRFDIVTSMSRKGNCWDNAPTESFFGSLKQEWIGDSLYLTREQAICDIREYVGIYYNAKRLHSSLGYLTPMEFEKCA
jgi:putative transposase